MLGVNTCKQCYEEHIVKEYKNLKNTLEKDFIKYIDDWFKQHPNVESMYLSQTNGWTLYQSITIVPSKLTKETNVKVTFK